MGHGGLAFAMLPAGVAGVRSAVIHMRHSRHLLLSLACAVCAAASFLLLLRPFKADPRWSML